MSLQIFIRIFVAKNHYRILFSWWQINPEFATLNCTHVFDGSSPRYVEARDEAYRETRQEPVEYECGELFARNDPQDARLQENGGKRASFF